ncbi:putative quinol monooxygenase [Flavobacterium sp. 1355]|jgi:quinol monooxygenase YgiN|uniref:putative quinol monooxygenase n=1 Tax=Flavobacterium sp. 1355 TaxID=2806571 RepID=UPI001AE2A37B|nr:putative quinol monooxygenase [Flavobacterium sp. 1355]MBP1225222.1 quinol monooxygenase YgiN [Flavobacterium sp. 1355]
MITITALIKSKKENTQEIQNMLQHLVNETRNEKACLRYSVQKAKNVFIFWEEWQDQAGFDLHMTQPHLQDFITKTVDLVTDPIEVHLGTQIL